MSIAVGIDLGTTNSGVAVHQNKEPEILRLGEDPFIPSCVAFNGSKVLVGKEALNHENKSNVISGIKYIIGLDYNAAKEVADRQELSFDLTNEDGMPLIKVDYNDGKESFSPEEISAMILSELKTIAKERLGCQNIKAVITVPTNFTSKRRTATKLAAEIAGIDVLQVVNESTAAAIAHEKLKPDPLNRRRRVLVFDLGGGTLDITIIKTRGKRIMVRASDGSLELGGENFTRNLVDDTENAVNSKGALNDFTKCTINEEANSVKESLSIKYKESFSFKVNGNPMTASRARLTQVNKHQYGAAIQLVTDAMTRAGITKDKIHHVVLSGGSVKIPFFREELGKLFGKKKIYCDKEESDQLVAKGAAILASFFSETNNTNGSDYLSAIRGLDFSDVTPFPLGFCGCNSATIIVIPKNTKIPARETRSWNINQRGVTRIKLQICEGDRSKFDENELLDSINIPIAFTRDRKVSLAVTFELRSNCWLCVTVKQKDTANDPEQFHINFERHLSVERLENQRKRLEKIMLQTKLQQTLENKSVKDREKQSPTHEYDDASYSQQQLPSEPAYDQAMDVGEPDNRAPELQAQEGPNDDDNYDDVRTCTALYDYDARSTKEVSMKKGGRFSVIQADEGNGWTRVLDESVCWARVPEHNRDGLVPTSYLQFD